jgi:catechol-2,3-dioxygenase
MESSMDSHADKASRPLDTKPVSPSLFAHFVLRTPQKDTMRDWYRTVLNARLVFENDYISFITYDDEHHRVAFVSAPELKRPADADRNLSHMAYTFADLGQLLSTYKRLKGEGILPYRPINHGPTVSMYYKDPDGNGVELQVDAFKTKQQAADYFKTAAFKADPIGVPFDPEEMVRDWEAGVPEAELVKQKR